MGPRPPFHRDDKLNFELFYMNHCRERRFRVTTRDGPFNLLGRGMETIIGLSPKFPKYLMEYYKFLQSFHLSYFLVFTGIAIKLRVHRLPVFPDQKVSLSKKKKRMFLLLFPVPEVSFRFVNFPIMGFTFTISTISTASAHRCRRQTLVVAFRISFLKCM